MENLTFENVPESTYWMNPKSGVVYSCFILRNTWEVCDELCDDGTQLFEEGGYDYDTNSKHINISSINTKTTRELYYTWDELVAKFNYLGECDSEHHYVHVLSNKSLYRNYKYCKGSLPGLKRLAKSEPHYEKWTECLEKNTYDVEQYEGLFEEIA